MQREPIEVVTLGSDLSHAEAYQRLARRARGLTGVLFEDIATARLFAAGGPASSAAALVFGQAGHPRVARYEALARAVRAVLPAALDAAQALPLTASDASTASALRMGGLQRSVTVLPARHLPAKPPAPLTGSLNVAVFGATTPWRARVARQAIAAAFARRPFDRVARVHVDAGGGDAAPAGWDRLRSLEPGDPVHLGVFLDGGCFADLVQRLYDLRNAGAAVFTSGMGAYADAPQDGGVDVRPDALFDSLRSVVASADAER